MEELKTKPIGVRIEEISKVITDKISEIIDMEKLSKDRSYILELQETILKPMLIDNMKQIDEEDLLCQVYFQITPNATPQLGLDEFCAGVCFENLGKWKTCEHNLSYIKDFRPDNQFLKWWYFESIRLGIGGFTRAYFDPYLKMDVVTYSIPAYSKDGFLIGVLGIDLDYSDFTDIMKKRLVENIREDIEKIKKEHELIGTSNMLSNQYLDVNTFEIISGNDIFDGLPSQSVEMNSIMPSILKASISDANVLLQGETGVGKDFIATFIHEKSKFSKGSLINVNCCALPENLIESEFFGYGKGAFTGAKSEGKAGYFEAANNGTIILNEIGDLSLHMQAKFLNVIQEKEVIRIGETKKRPSNFRLIAITNKNLQTLVAQNKFREDLYYRLHVLPITIPPLRKRKEDLFSLLNVFLARNIEKYNVKKRFSVDLVSFLMKYDWPGNIRELENLIERLVLNSAYTLITEADLPKEFVEKLNSFHEDAKKYEDPITVVQETRNINTFNDQLNNSYGQIDNSKNQTTLPNDQDKDLKSVREQYEANLIRETYHQLGSSYKVAKALGISQTQAYNKIKKYVLSNKV